MKSKRAMPTAVARARRSWSNEPQRRVHAEIRLPRGDLSHRAPEDAGRLGPDSGRSASLARRAARPDPARAHGPPVPERAQLDDRHAGVDIGRPALPAVETRAGFI